MIWDFLSCTDQVYLYNIDKLSPIQNHSLHKGVINSASFNTNGKVVASGG